MQWPINNQWSGGGCSGPLIINGEVVGAGAQYSIWSWWLQWPYNIHFEGVGAVAQ